MTNNGTMRFGHLAVDDQHWEPVVAPVNCNSYTEFIGKQLMHVITGSSMAAAEREV